MNQLAIQAIEGYIGLPLISPTSIHEVDAKEIAAAMTYLNDEANAAADQMSDDDDGLELAEAEDRLREVTELIEEAIASCHDCDEEGRCQRCKEFRAWLATA